MKHITLLLLLCSGFTVLAQTTEEPPTPVTTAYNEVSAKKHEVKIGAIKLLSGSILEATYEHIYSEDFTFGASMLGNFDSGNGYPEDFSVTPFARFYFTEPKHYGAKGFFVEGFAKYLTGKHEHEEYTYVADPDYGSYTDYRWVEKRYNTASLGIALGWKWINRSGFVFEILAGAGRNIGAGNDAPEASFRGDFNLGYRF